MLNKASYVLASDTNIDYTDVDTGLITGFLDCFFNCIDSFIDVEDNPLHYPFRLCLAHAKYFEFTKLVLATYDHTNFRCAYIESDYYFFLFHDDLIISGCVVPK
jgi:hypothetical protein